MEERRMEFRLEHDSIGDREVPAEAYYGVQSLRAKENFHITGLGMHPQLIISVAQIKKAAALTNQALLMPVMRLLQVSFMGNLSWMPSRAVPAPL